MSANPDTTLQLLVDSRDADAWRRAEAVRGAEAPDGAVVLRDSADLEHALAFAEGIIDRNLVDGVREFLRVPYAMFRIGLNARRLRLAGVSAPVAALAREMPDLAVEEETENRPPPADAPDAPFVLVMSNDVISNVTKTSEALADAAREIGLAGEVRDTSPFRTLVTFEPGQLRDGNAAWEKLRGEIRATYARRLRDRAPNGGATVLSLDLHWFLDPGLFLEDDRVERIASLWFDDVKTWCQAGPNLCLPGAVDRLQEALHHPKVVHCCYGRGQMEEMRRLGFANVRLSHLAAPAAYLRHDAPPEVTDRAVFVGNPGLQTPPPPDIRALLERGAELEEIRAAARSRAMKMALRHFSALAAREPQFGPWLAQTLMLRAAKPHASALALLAKAGRDYPAPFEAVNASKRMLDAAFFVKMANQFDRPAVVHRLHRAGLVDVYSAPEQWKGYGIAARPPVPFHELPRILQRYTVHLNGANASRDATANEKLFEIAACGRLSLNLPSPDVTDCYAEGEVAFAPTLAALEERTRHFLAHPDEALAWGARARARTAREHLWSHRLRALFAAPNPSP